MMKVCSGWRSISKSYKNLFKRHWLLGSSGIEGFHLNTMSKAARLFRDKSKVVSTMSGWWKPVKDSTARTGNPLRKRVGGKGELAVIDLEFSTAHGGEEEDEENQDLGMFAVSEYDVKIFSLCVPRSAAMQLDKHIKHSFSLKCRKWHFFGRKINRLYFQWKLPGCLGKFLF